MIYRNIWGSAPKPYYKDVESIINGVETIEERPKRIYTLIGGAETTLKIAKVSVLCTRYSHGNK